jgi:hypothetical protein
MKEWTSAESFQDRCNRLDAGFKDSTAGFIQLKRKDKTFPKGTVLDDKLRDTLFGGLGSDWFFDFANDTTDRGPDDR